jgi:hypothetical protein
VHIGKNGRAYYSLAKLSEADEAYEAGENERLAKLPPAERAKAEAAIEHANAKRNRGTSARSGH